MAKILKVDGSEVELEDCGLKSLQSAVGGLIERVSLPGDRDMIVNEDGLHKQLLPNPNAIRLSGKFIVGDVVICEKGEFI